MTANVITYYVEGQRQTYGAFFTRQAADDHNNTLGGWGNVIEKVEKAEVISIHFPREVKP